MSSNAVLGVRKLSGSAARSASSMAFFARFRRFATRNFGEERQIIDARERLLPALFQCTQHFARPQRYRFGEPCQFRDLDAIGTIGEAGATS